VTGSGDGSDVIPTLLDVLRSGSPEQKCDAATRLLLLGPAAAGAVPALLEALRDPRRCEAPGSWDGCGCEYQHVQEYAVRALAHIAPAQTAREVIPVMIELVGRESGWQNWSGGRGGPHYVTFDPGVVRAFGPEAVAAVLEAYRAKAAEGYEDYARAAEYLAPESE
jgi:hypothetical protein